MNAINDAFLQQADCGVLRLITAGSVDDGKSTLIGRLLYDSKGVFADQLDAISKAKYKRVAGDGIDFALLTDGLEAEREQGITIDVAYRYFSTPFRKFIVADAPGHEQYTRNMVTGASTADAAIILIDATRVVDGKLLTQTKRHSTIARLLGIRHVVVAINKMDLVGWDQSIFNQINLAYAELAQKLGISHYHVLPISALEGDNVVNRSTNSPWYEGPPLLTLLEGLSSQHEAVKRPLRFPIQWVSRHGGARTDDFRGYAGRIVSGEMRAGDDVVVQPSGVTARIKTVRIFDRPVDVAVAGDSVLVELDRDISASRGDILSHVSAPARVSREFEAEICWLDAQALSTSRKYLLKFGTRVTSAKVRAVLSQRDIHELQEVHEQGGHLAMNDIGRIAFVTRDALAVDAYEDSPATGAFILIDEVTHQTAAAGMLR